MLLVYLILAFLGLFSLYLTDKYAKPLAVSAFLRSRRGSTGRTIGWTLLLASLFLACWVHGWGTGLFFLLLGVMLVASGLVIFYPLFKKI